MYETQYNFLVCYYVQYILGDVNMNVSMRQRQSNLEYKQALKSLRIEAKERKLYAPCENYRRLVCQQAWAAWRRLPAHTKAWIEIDDMINHGMLIVYKYITEQYDSKRSSSITTGLHHILHNMYIYDYVAVYGSWKRGWEKGKDGKLAPLHMHSIEAMQAKEYGDGLSMPHIDTFMFTSESSIVNNVLTKCFVVPAMQQVYSEASEDLKKQIVEWFWQKSEKIHPNGKPFKKMAKEFRVLADAQDLHFQDCLHLVRSVECLDSLSRNIFQIPYDETCSPVMRGI